MKNETVKALGDGAVALSVGTAGATSLGSWMDFLNNNAPAIGLIMAFIFGVIGVILQWMSAQSDARSKRNEAEIEKQRQQINLLHEALTNKNED